MFIFKCIVKTIAVLYNIYIDIYHTSHTIYVYMYSELPIF